MLKALKERAREAEFMDNLDEGGPVLREALRHLRLLNRIFYAPAPTLYGLRRLWEEAGKPGRLSILDVGSGSGDVNRLLLRWADASGIDLSITLADITEEACEEARLFFRNEPRVQVQQKDLFALPDGCADVVTGTQFVHHFAEDDLVLVVKRMLNASRLGVVINDIHRHWLPWSAVWLTARIISNNRYILHDGPLSVAKGFRSEDWSRLAEALGGAQMSYSWRPLFRYAVIIRNTYGQFENRS